MSNPTPYRAYEIFREVQNSMLKDYPNNQNVFIINSRSSSHDIYLDIRGDFELTSNARLKQDSLTSVQVTLTPESELYIAADIGLYDLEGWNDDANDFLQRIVNDAANVMRSVYRKCHDEGIKVFVDKDPIQGLGQFENNFDSRWLQKLKSDLSCLTQDWNVQHGTPFVNLKEPCGLLSVSIGEEFQGKGEAYTKQFVTLPESGDVWLERLCEAAGQFSKTPEGLAMIKEGEFDWLNVLHAIQSDYPHFYSNLGMMPAEKALKESGGNINVCMMGDVSVSRDDDLLDLIDRVLTERKADLSSLIDISGDPLSGKKELGSSPQNG